MTHAKQYAEITESHDNDIDVDSMSNVARMRHVREQENELAALEAQLAAEQRALLSMQKARYNDAGGK